MGQMSTQGRGSASAVLILAVLLASTQAVQATDHPVNGDGVWRFGDYSVWAASTQFTVGDSLIFTYNPAIHNVAVLGSASSYDACDVSSPIQSYGTGNDNVFLDQAGTWYFTCATANHCPSMKFSIQVLASSGAQGPSSSAPPPSSSSVPPPSSSVPPPSSSSVPPSSSSSPAPPPSSSAPASSSSPPSSSIPPTSSKSPSSSPSSKSPSSSPSAKSPSGAPSPGSARYVKAALTTVVGGAALALFCGL